MQAGCVSPCELLFVYRWFTLNFVNFYFKKCRLQWSRIKLVNIFSQTELKPANFKAINRGRAKRCYCYLSLSKLIALFLLRSNYRWSAWVQTWTNNKLNLKPAKQTARFDKFFSQSLKNLCDERTRIFHLNSEPWIRLWLCPNWKATGE